ncbi:hypothetical protein [Dyella telluris]|uniref:Uncharacterized protein n=1 Tax=Dyella telluris TaxID=2763498 RepID=A0A7G8Q621_9GAMM|nr:hypothetical protein [Dyella telluris]QNK02229.1 hypothetical protein H8F01_03440 [Dyella telluris]
MAILLFGVALDLAWHIFPDAPGIEAMRHSDTLALAAWIGCGVLAIMTVFLLSVRPRLGYLTLVALAACYVPVSLAVWRQFAVLSYWASLAAMSLATYALFGARAEAKDEDANAPDR